MSSKYDLVIVYIHRKSGRIVKIDDYIEDVTQPIFTSETSFLIYRKSKIKIAEGKKLYNYGYTWSAGVYYIPDMITEKRLKEIELENARIDAIEELWFDILVTVKTYKALNFFNPYVGHLKNNHKDEAFKLTTQFGNRPNKLFGPSDLESTAIKDQLIQDGLDELYRRSYIMYSEIARKINQSEEPYEELKQARRSYFNPVFEQTGTEPFDTTSG